MLLSFKCFLVFLQLINLLLTCDCLENVKDHSSLHHKKRETIKTEYLINTNNDLTTLSRNLHFKPFNEKNLGSYKNKNYPSSSPLLSTNSAATRSIVSLSRHSLIGVQSTHYHGLANGRSINQTYNDAAADFAPCGSIAPYNLRPGVCACANQDNRYCVIQVEFSAPMNETSLQVGKWYKDAWDVSKLPPNVPRQSDDFGNEHSPGMKIQANGRSCEASSRQSRFIVKELITEKRESTGRTQILSLAVNFVHRCRGDPLGQFLVGCVRINSTVDDDEFCHSNMTVIYNSNNEEWMEREDTSAEQYYLSLGREYEATFDNDKYVQVGGNIGDSIDIETPDVIISIYTSRGNPILPGRYLNFILTDTRQKNQSVMMIRAKNGYHKYECRVGIVNTLDILEIVYDETLDDVVTIAADFNYTCGNNFTVIEGKVRFHSNVTTHDSVKPFATRTNEYSPLLEHDTYVFLQSMGRDDKVAEGKWLVLAPPRHDIHVNQYQANGIQVLVGGFELQFVNIGDEPFVSNKTYDHITSDLKQMDKQPLMSVRGSHRCVDCYGYFTLHDFTFLDADNDETSLSQEQSGENNIVAQTLALDFVQYCNNEHSNEPLHGTIRIKSNIPIFYGDRDGVGDACGDAVGVTSVEINGGYIGQNQYWSFSTEDGNEITKEEYVPNGLVYIRVDDFSLQFETKAKPLQKGRYENAIRYTGGSSPDQNALSVTGKGRGCNALQGMFEIFELSFSEDEEQKDHQTLSLSADRICSFAIEFKFSCDGGPETQGRVKYNSETQFKGWVTFPYELPPTNSPTKRPVPVPIPAPIYSESSPSNSPFNTPSTNSEDNQYWVRFLKGLIIYIPFFFIVGFVVALCTSHFNDQESQKYIVPVLAIAGLLGACLGPIILYCGYSIGRRCCSRHDEQLEDTEVCGCSEDGNTCNKWRIGNQNDVSYDQLEHEEEVVKSDHLSSAVLA